jgi:hypothetical protein
MNQICKVLATFILLTMGLSEAQSSMMKQFTTDELMTEATLIFEGTVVDVSHRNSDVLSSDDVEMPHTFVTFKIDRVFKGASEAKDYITLRMQSGPDGRGNTLIIPGIPQFELGDHQIIFVHGNGVRICPVVGWEQGQFHLIDNQVLASDGRKLYGNNESFIRSGVRIEGNKQLDAKAFRQMIASKVQKLYSAESQRIQSPERSVAIFELLRVKNPRPTTAPPSR